MRDPHIWIARGFLVGLCLFLVYYPYKIFSVFLPFVFSGPEGWQTHWLIDDDALIPLWWRLLEFLIWIPTIVATLAMTVAAIFLVMLFLRNVYFETKTVRALKWVGLSACIAGFTALLAMAVEPWVITAWNETLERKPIVLQMESGETGVMLTGLGLYLLGFVLQVAVLKHSENQEIV